MYVSNYVGDHLGQMRSASVDNVIQAVRGEGGVRWDPGLRRPYIDKNGTPAVSILTGRTTLVKGEQVPIREHVTIGSLIANYGIHLPIYNATLLRKEEWIQLDEKVHLASRYRLQFYSDVAAASSYSVDGMRKTMLEYETMSDPGEAVVDIDALTPGRNDVEKFAGDGMPLLITHSDFFLSAREQGVSGNQSSVRRAEAAGRRVAESIEKTSIGVRTGPTWGGVNTALTYRNTSKVYGLINYPDRLTKTNMPVPTGSNASAIITAVLSCIQTLKMNKFYGPFMVYASSDWDEFLDADYILTGGNVATQTLRQRLESISNIQGIKSLDFLFGTQADEANGPGADVDVTLKSYRLVFVQMTSEVLRAVNGMGVTTLQWETVGGMQLNFKVMAIQAVQFFCDFYGNCGILDATTS